jgi:hypothetical protein
MRREERKQIFSFSPTPFILVKRRYSRCPFTSIHAGIVDRYSRYSFDPMKIGWHAPRAPATMSPNFSAPFRSAPEVHPPLPPDRAAVPVPAATAPPVIRPHNAHIIDAPSTFNFQQEREQKYVQVDKFLLTIQGLMNIINVDYDRCLTTYEWRLCAWLM